MISSPGVTPAKAGVQKFVLSEWLIVKTILRPLISQGFLAFPDPAIFLPPCFLLTLFFYPIFFSPKGKIQSKGGKPDEPRQGQEETMKPGSPGPSPGGTNSLFPFLGFEP
jgi:hypothetical protein